MPCFIALLRGINVGRNSLTMDRLRELCSDLGFKNIQTYLQSGNIVFDATGSPTRLSQVMERKLAGATRLPVTVILRTAAEMERVIANNPFLPEKGIDPTKLHVTFLAAAPGKQTLHSLSAGADRFRISGKEVYVYCPNGYGRTKLSNNAIEKTLGIRATTRNWNTVNKLHQLASG